MEQVMNGSGPHVHPQGLSIGDFTYELPEDRIARHPLEERDASRLLVYRNGRVGDHLFRGIADLLPPDALLILNDTRVVNARLHFRRATGAVLEFMVADPEGGRPMEQALMDEGTSRWWCMVGNAKRWKGEEVVAAQASSSGSGGNDFGLSARRVEQRDGMHLIEFRWNGGPFIDALQRMGSVPLPPYMRREAMPDDAARYNTVFAANDGSIAAPTASLHFSEAVLARCAAKGIHSVSTTLHVGAGTFLPVKSARMEGHVMHREQIRVPLDTLVELRRHLRRGSLVPVGTTALRTIESVYWHGVAVMQGRAGAHMNVGQWEPYGHRAGTLPLAEDALGAVIEGLEETGSPLVGTTSLLIAPGYEFHMADALVTNFHQPDSTLLLLVAAFLGPSWRTVYDHALREGYRFLSYGDGSLLFGPVIETPDMSLS
ncbi:MAG: S-adenosylmethionine:tRNA ribosyltransferase-isomerase [Flavobacteriales bacterium]|nr:S-adenosylmethionine:tRNA ribosyltransferase-isomerase [Flavobacteriales bacterium]